MGCASKHGHFYALDDDAIAQTMLKSCWNDIRKPFDASCDIPMDYASKPSPLRALDDAIVLIVPKSCRKNI